MENETSIYFKNVDELSEDELQVWEEAYNKIMSGEKLFAQPGDDPLAHIGWAVGLLIDVLAKNKGDLPGLYTLIELGVTDEGICVTKVVMEKETSADTNDQVH